MGQLQVNPNLPDDCAPDHPNRRSRLACYLIAMIRSKWVAAFIVATAVSWSFSEVDEIQTKKLARQQAVTMCVVKGVAKAQENATVRVQVDPILDRCEKQHGN